MLICLLITLQTLTTVHVSSTALTENDSSLESSSPPQFTEEPKPLEYVASDHDHVMTCAARGSEPLRYRWIKEGGAKPQRFQWKEEEEVTDGAATAAAGESPRRRRFVTPFSESGFLRISSMKESDYGVYRCLVSNPLGAVLSRQSIIVLAKLELKALEGESVKNETVLGTRWEECLFLLLCCFCSCFCCYFSFYFSFLLLFLLFL